MKDKDESILLAMHGQPVWCYLYSKMIPFLTDAGIRVIAPIYQVMENLISPLQGMTIAIKIRWIGWLTG